MRSEEWWKGRIKLYSAPIPIFINRLDSYFTGNDTGKGLLFCLALWRIFLVIAIDKVKRGIKSYTKTVFLITLYNLYNLGTSDNRKCFTKEISRTITFTIAF